MKNIGIVGVGGFARVILNSILRIEEEGLARLVGAVIRNPAKYPEAVERLQREGRSIYVSLADMLNRAELDLVALPVGVPSHRDLAIQALEAGHDVVLEKPVAATVQEVDDIVSAEERTGHLCAIGYQHIHTPAIQTLREEIERGRLGRLKRLKTYALWPRGRMYYDRNVWAGQLRFEGHWVLDGPLTNAFAHFFTNMVYLLDAEAGDRAGFESLQAELYRAKEIPSYDTVCLRARTKGGAEVYIALTHAVNELVNPITEIEAEKASATWIYDGAKVVIRYQDGVVRTVEGAGTDPHAEVFRDAIAVLEGKRLQPLFTTQDGRAHVLAVNLAFESSSGIAEIPESERKVTVAQNGDQHIAVKGLEEIMRRAYRETKLLSELGVPWAKASQEVSPEGYQAFPQSDKLRAFLAEMAEKEHLYKSRDQRRTQGGFQW